MCVFVCLFVRKMPKISRHCFLKKVESCVSGMLGGGGSGGVKGGKINDLWLRQASSCQHLLRLSLPAIMVAF